MFLQISTPRLDPSLIGFKTIGYLIFFILMSFRKFFFLFPDPWPKERHKKRRILSQENIEQFTNALKIKGNIYFASDVKDYFTQAEILFKSSGFKILNSKNYHEKPKIINATKYEIKAKKNGRKIYYLIAKKLLD